MIDFKDRPESLRALVELSRRLLDGQHFDARLSIALKGLDELFGISHTMMLVPMGEGSLSTLASHGYPPGGVGATVVIGQGVAGMAAERKCPVRVSQLQRGLNMVRAIHGAVEADPSVREIPFVGLFNAQSQLAVPAVVDGQLVGVLYAEDTQAGKLTEEHGHILEIVANMLAANLLREPSLAAPAPAEQAPGGSSSNAAASRAKATLAVRFYEEDASVFFDGEYVIRSIPGSILWKLMRSFVERGTTEFNMRELRLDPSLKSTGARDNLDARLILLRRRLEERFPYVSITRTGRGRFVLATERQPVLEKG